MNASLEVLGSTNTERLGMTRLAGADVVLGYGWLQKEGIVMDMGTLAVTRGVQDTTSSRVVEVGSDLCEVLATARTTSRKRQERSARMRQSSPNSIPLRINRWEQNRLSGERLRATVSEELEEATRHVDGHLGFEEYALSPEEEREVETLVPEHYHEFLDVFHPRRGAEALAPNRVYDLRIKLKPDAELKVAPLYKLTPEQMGALKDLLARELRAGRIRPSNSHYVMTRPNQQHSHAQTARTMCRGVRCVTTSTHRALKAAHIHNVQSRIGVTNDTKGPDKSHAISEARRALQALPTSFSLHHVDNRPLAQQWTLSWTMSTTPPPLSPSFNNASSTSRHPRRSKQQARHDRQQAHQGQQARQTTIRLAEEQQGSTETMSSGEDVMELVTDT